MMKTAFIDADHNYLDFFGLKFNPFPVAPDEENFYFSEHIEQVVSEIIHGIVTRKGFMVLTGDVGLGKTTISRWIMSILAAKGVATSLVFHTSYQDVGLLAEINRDFGIKPDGSSFSDQMWALNQFLLERNRDGRNCAIIIDDAQNLSRKSLELIRMVSNLEAYHEKLVQILLIGQPELTAKLNSEELRQLKSRIIINKEARPLGAREIENYIKFKLNNAGNKGLISVDQKALGRLHRFTRGNFRQINTLMDRCLYAAFVSNTKTISKRTIKSAHTDLNPRPLRTSSGRPALVLGAAVLTLLLFLGGFYGLWLRPTNSAEPSARAAAPADLRTEPKALGSSPTGTTAPGDPDHQTQASRIERPFDPMPAAVIEFLSSYNLERFAAPFYRALQEHRLKDLATNIFDQTGHCLIRLETLPERIQRQYNILAYPSVTGDTTSYYLFWQPTIHFPQFYYRLMGQDVRSLQTLLARIDLYHDHLDGIAGKNLLQALIRFQELAGLQVTGYPDEKTVFLLCHFEEKKPQ